MAVSDETCSALASALLNVSESNLVVILALLFERCEHAEQRHALMQDIVLRAEMLKKQRSRANTRENEQ